MTEQKHELLLYSFIKSQCLETSSTNSIPEKVILIISSDIEFKIHEIAKLTRNIMLKSKRNYCKTEDLNSALFLTFNNLLLLKFDSNSREEKPINIMENQISLNVFSSSPVMTFNKVAELNSVSKRVYTKLVKCIFDRDEDTVKNILSVISQKSCLNEVLMAFICNLNEIIDQMNNEEFFMRIIMMLEKIISNKTIHISENPLRDLCISLSLKLLWSASNFNLKLRVTHILQAIIRRQYLLQHTIHKAIVDRLLNEFNQPFLTCFTYSGCLVGLISLDYGLYLLTDDFISNIWTLPDIIKENYSTKEAISYLFYKTSLNMSLYDISYDKFKSMIDIFYTSDFGIQYANPVCFHYKESPDQDSGNFESNLEISNVSITPYGFLQREIDMLLHGKTVDDLKTENYELDDMPPPILFRKSSFQSHLSGNKFTMEDVGFVTKSFSANKRQIRINIAGINQSDEGFSSAVFESEFYNAFQRCHQFIVNSKNVKTFRNKNYNRKSKRSNCALYNLQYLL